MPVAILHNKDVNRLQVEVDEVVGDAEADGAVVTSAITVPVCSSDGEPVFFCCTVVWDHPDRIDELEEEIDEDVDDDLEDDDEPPRKPSPKKRGRK